MKKIIEMKNRLGVARSQGWAKGQGGLAYKRETPRILVVIEMFCVLTCINVNILVEILYL